MFPYESQGVDKTGFRFGTFIYGFGAVAVVMGYLWLIGYTFTKNKDRGLPTMEIEGVVISTVQAVNQEAGHKQDDPILSIDFGDPTPTLAAEPTETPQPTQIPVVVEVVVPTQEPLMDRGETLSIFGRGRCEGCAEYSVPIRFTNYWPNTPPNQAEVEAGNGARLIKTWNCWQYDLDKEWCVSHMASDIPWEGFVGVAAACPYDWPMGTVIDVPVIGRSYICMDRGTMLCHGNPPVCDVDLLLEDKPPWDGQVIESFVRVPGW